MRTSWAVKLICLRGDKFTSLGLNGAVVVEGDVVEIVPRTEKELRNVNQEVKDDPGKTPGLGASFSTVRISPQSSIFASMFQLVPMCIVFSNLASIKVPSIL